MPVTPGGGHWACRRWILRPILVVNPRTDATFEALAREELDANPEVDAVALEARLRRRYPNATIHVRLLSHEPLTVWYLYRDGSWTRPE